MILAILSTHSKFYFHLGINILKSKNKVLTILNVIFIVSLKSSVNLIHLDKKDFHTHNHLYKVVFPNI